MSTKLGPQQTKEGVKVKQTRVMRWNSLDWLTRDILDPMIVGEDRGCNGHEHELEQAQSLRSTGQFRDLTRRCPSPSARLKDIITLGRHWRFHVLFPLRSECGIVIRPRRTQY